MYIENLKVSNVRLLAEQEFSFLNEDGTPRMWTVIVGENGVCKSTILQTIALAAMGPKLGSALVQDAQRLRNLNSPKAATFEAKFDFLPNFMPSPFVSSLKIEPDRFDLVPGKESAGALHLDELRAKRISQGFVAGYGVGRFLAEPGETGTPQNPLVERVFGLFNSRHKILGLNFYKTLQNKKRAPDFLRALQGALAIGGLPSERLLPGFSDIKLRTLRPGEASV